MEKVISNGMLQKMLVRSTVIADSLHRSLLKVVFLFYRENDENGDNNDASDEGKNIEY